MRKEVTGAAVWKHQPPALVEQLIVNQERLTTNWIRYEPCSFALSFSLDGRLAQSASPIPRPPLPRSLQSGEISDTRPPKLSSYPPQEDQETQCSGRDSARKKDWRIDVEPHIVDTDGRLRKLDLV